MGRGVVQVAIRTRPTASFDSANIQVHDDKTSLNLRLPKTDNPNAQDSWNYKCGSPARAHSQPSHAPARAASRPARPSQ